MSLLLGAAAQFGIYVAFLLAMATGLFTPGQAAAIGIIGGADGPTAIYIANTWLRSWWLPLQWPPTPIWP